MIKKTLIVIMISLMSLFSSCSNLNNSNVNNSNNLNSEKVNVDIVVLKNIILNVHSNDVDIFLFSTIDMNMSTSLRSIFIELEKNSIIRIVNIHIESNGGLVTPALSIIDVMNKYKKMGWTINTYASGFVASAAVPIFVTGNNRIASSKTIFMVHPMSMNGYEKNINIFEGMLYKRYVNSLVSNTKLSYNQWMEKIGEITWFDVDDALKWGVVTEIE